MLVLTDLKYPLGLEGTHIYKETKITILWQASISYLLHHKSKETFAWKNRYTITAIAKYLPHPGQRATQMLKWLEWSRVWAQNTNLKKKKNTVSFQDNKSQPVDYSILPSVAQLKLNRNCSLFSSY